MEEEKMLVPSGLKTVDGKDIMCYTGAFYLKNEEKIKRIIKNRILKLKDGFIPNELNNDVTFGKRINVANNEKKSKNTIKIKG